MFSRLTARLPKATTIHLAAPRPAQQSRLASRLAVNGSKGRSMPDRGSRATAAAANVDATFTIRVCRIGTRAPAPLLLPVVCMLTFALC